VLFSNHIFKSYRIYHHFKIEAATMDMVQLLRSYLVSPPAQQSNLSLETDICPICRDNLFGV
jgi:hypothetical protein